MLDFPAIRAQIERDTCQVERAYPRSDSQRIPAVQEVMMDGRRFDRLTRALASSTTRRTALKGAVAGAAALIPLNALRDANATFTTCLIDNVPYVDGTLNPTNPCEICNPIANFSSWTVRANGSTCQAGDDCLTAGVCRNAVCKVVGDTGWSVVVCIQGNTRLVPRAALPYYLLRGATRGACCILPPV